MKNAINLSNTVLPLVARLLLASLFLISGIGKLSAPAATIGYITAMGLPFPTLGYVIALIVELGGGLLLVFGFQTRLTALALALFSIVTGLVFHSAVGDQNQMIHLLKNISIAGGLLQVVAFGAGAFSLDARKPVTGAARIA
ncbi:putative membrane protein [Herbaspirillum sp. CF444]|uniref:DoxX family protein n=1 Tax=Herbaspirillum sp. CF444 TaxID=1144319 RepID=UPI0002722DFB|nr:DoxX family protein [Herbaspirillum sp. CF444]EJL83647.1 putative membrane protein [Herbaspirillum sp. CF444]